MTHFLYGEFWGAIHNAVAHPVYQLLWWLSLCGLIKPVVLFGDWLHEWTTPNGHP